MLENIAQAALDESTKREGRCLAPVVVKWADAPAFLRRDHIEGGYLIGETVAGVSVLVLYRGHWPHDVPFSHPARIF